MNCYLKFDTVNALLLITIISATSCFAMDDNYHICQFDKYNKDDQTLLLVEELPESQSSTWKAYTATTTDSWQPIRILVSTADLHDEKKYCKTKSQKIRDFMNNEIECNDYYFFEDENRKAIKRIVYSAVQMHAARLKVKPIKNGFKVPDLKGELCSRFTVPEDHKESGITNADMVLYVAPFVSQESNFYAISASCAKLKDGRPVVGGIAYDTFWSTFTSYNVRIAAHEIAHVLGFSYKLMSEKTPELLKHKQNVRQKSSVTEFTGPKTVNAVKEHFQCETATGMELEDEMGYLEIPSHSHWERRNAREELMAPVVSKGYYSALTIAAFTDLGYYQGNMEEAEPMQWGYGSGCALLENPCFENGKTEYPTMFCTEHGENIEYCDENMDLMECNALNTYGPAVPSYFNYFLNDKKKYSSAFMDNCPVFVRIIAQDCQHDQHSVLKGIKGPDSLCFKKAPESTIIQNEKHRGMCVKAKVTNDNKVQITYEDKKMATCTDGKATLDGSYKGVILECPDANYIPQKEKMENAILIEEEKMNYEQTNQIITLTDKDLQRLQEGKSYRAKAVKTTPYHKIPKEVKTQVAEKEDIRAADINPKTNEPIKDKNSDDVNESTDAENKDVNKENSSSPTSKNKEKRLNGTNINPKDDKKSKKMEDRKEVTNLLITVKMDKTMKYNVIHFFILQITLLFAVIITI